MCVGLSARVVNVRNGTAIIDSQGVQRSVSADLLNDLEPGDYVMVHAGIAIARIGQTETEEAGTLDSLLTGTDQA